jgi:hypothetical protein
MRRRQAALGHRLHQISQTERESKVSPHTQDDDSAAEVRPLNSSSAIFSWLIANRNQFSQSDRAICTIVLFPASARQERHVFAKRAPLPAPPHGRRLDHARHDRSRRLVSSGKCPVCPVRRRPVRPSRDRLGDGRARPRLCPAQACPGPAYSTLDYIGTSHCVLRPVQAFYFLALDPRATASNDQLVRQRVVDLFNTLTSDSNGRQVARPLDGWSDGPTAQAILLIRNTPVVWGALGHTGRSKANWLMTSMAVLGN